MNIQYRKDIDGLRAIAVISVVIYHAFPNILPGGFVGVDIFFVISGFLITSIILKEQHYNQFNIVNFYKKRIRRIFPALIFLTIFLIVVGYLILYTNEYRQLGKHIVASSLFISNIILIYEVGYFDISADLKPMLHLWSLSIEEQFYLIWPLIIILTKRNLLFSISIILCSLLFSFNIYLAYYTDSNTYFNPLTRSWEILLGAIVAQIIYKDYSIKNKSHNSIISSVSILLILYTSFSITKETKFPGFTSLLVVLPTSFLLLTLDKSHFYYYISKFKSLLYIGLISYPLYLWHWPLLALNKITNGSKNSDLRIFLIIIASFILSVFTYEYIEKKFKKSNPIKIVFVWFTIGMFGLIIYINNGLSFRYNELNLEHEFNKFNLSQKQITDCSSKKDYVETYFCKNVEANNPNVILVGDSHSSHLYTGFQTQPDNFFWEINLRGAGNCPPALHFESIEGCSKLNSATLEYINNTKSIEYVILGNYGALLEGSETFSAINLFNGYVEYIDSLIRNSKKIIFVVDNPTFNFDPNECKNSDLSFRNLISYKPIFCSGVNINDVKKRPKYQDLVEKLKNKYSNQSKNVLFYESTNILCPGDICPIVQNKGHLLYEDFNHLSLHGRIIVVHDLILKIRKHFSN